VYRILVVVGSPNYDPTTLFIPEYEFRQLSQTRKQYWEFKRKHYDTVVFFQVGGFFELYESDAYLGVNLFHLHMTDRTNMMSAGVPLSSFDLWASKFVALGYKVACIEQVASERPSVNQERQLTKYLTPGTLIDSMLLSDYQSSYLMAVVEQGDDYGVCFADCSVSEFHLGGFHDDKYKSVFETMLIQMKPREIVYPQGQLSHRTMALIKKYSEALMTPLSSSGNNDVCINNLSPRISPSQSI